MTVNIIKDIITGKGDMSRKQHPYNMLATSYQLKFLLMPWNRLMKVHFMKMKNKI